ncbi:magnesium/cobalt transporter CorA [Candidatus Woesearchaeota archaeon]|nr:magnesium/cobalt transporter CorA [Candidatus Woesearchaeota archaeon]
MIDIFYLDKGTLKKAKVNELDKIKKKRIWVDISGLNQYQADLVQKTFKLHPVTKEDMFLSHGTVKVEEFPYYLFCTFYTLGLNGKKNIKLSPLDFVIGDNFIISSHKEKLDAYERLKRDPERLKDILKKGTDIMFHRLLDDEIDNFFPVLEELDDEIEHLDNKIAKSANPELLTMILKIKRKVVEIKKVTFPQREKISFLARRSYSFISRPAEPYFRDLHDHAIRVSDIIENYRESVASSFDTYMTAIANSTNDIMKVLSIIATIALPLTVISGVYGTNFLNLPGQNAYNGFWIMVWTMVLFMGIMIIFFKKKRWI